MKNLEEQLVSFETAKLAKDKGFDEYCFKGYRNDTKRIMSLSQIDFDSIYENTSEEDIFEELFFKNSKVVEDYSITAPTQSLLQKWLREKYDTIVCPVPNNSKWSIYSEKFLYGNASNFDTYEEALEEGLLQALKLIK